MHTEKNIHQNKEDKAMKRNIIARASLMAVLIMTLVITSAIPAFASAPRLEKAKYEGSGKVDVDFTRDVYYKHSKVTVKDSKGKTYKAVITNRDDDDLDFRIKNFKTARTYYFTIKGVKVRGTSSYGTVKGTVKIPSVKSTISRTKALSIAKKHAANKWGASGFYDVDADRDTYRGINVWEVDFSTYSRGGEYEYEYEISLKTGKILSCHREWDD